eukprot:600146-Rhodomonas_salina.1
MYHATTHVTPAATHTKIPNPSRSSHLVHCHTTVESAPASNWTGPSHSSNGPKARFAVDESARVIGQNPFDLLRGHAEG